MAENVPFIGLFGLQISKIVSDSFKKNQATIDVYGRGDVTESFPNFRARLRRVVSFMLYLFPFLGKMKVVCIE
jgi:hypothetical protein